MNELYHYGVKRRSGRYPYGSGERPYQGSERNQHRRSHSLSKKNQQKLLKVGGLAVKSIIAAYGSYKLYESGILENIGNSYLDSLLKRGASREFVSVYDREFGNRFDYWMLMNL